MFTVQFEMTTEEIDVLIEVFESEISELRMEIADTDRYEYRLGLKDRKHLLEKFLAELRAVRQPAQ